MLISKEDTVKYRGVYWIVEGITPEAILLHSLTQFGDTFVIIDAKSDDAKEIQTLHDHNHKLNGGF